MNDLQLYAPIMSKRTFIVAGVGQEHRLGRWLRIKEARNCLRIVALSGKSETQDGDENEKEEEEEEDN